ncbi:MULTISPECIES: hypothetical protein [Corynebacterium]|uniref:Plasmid pRiA4b ORF-3 family protein n=1 Tax=Corynebacterium phoceense TaxID=1686286 RepID=A0A540R826_9CORY|nr:MULTISPECIES: hypothetical protein [Corynebacterium]KXB52478.1 hypothetical protein HMPREF0307_02229 [Corynebacterium sp. DNF00584]OFP18454.1 hypothetical protein HMPREF2998_12225 [Corynebacterium sp. HMSC065A05]TQE43890.1 plasmid pRiA4b ORF-3 family protein [Corynebacterium phoceense]
MISHMITLTSINSYETLSRTLIVPEATTFDDLHHLICAAFNFDATGFHYFEVEPTSLSDDPYDFHHPESYDCVIEALETDAVIRYEGGPGEEWTIEVEHLQYSHRMHRRAMLVDACGATPPPGTSFDDWYTVQGIIKAVQKKGTKLTDEQLNTCERVLGTRSIKQIRISDADPRRAKLATLTDAVRSVVITGELQASPQFELARATLGPALPFWKTQQFEDAAIAAAQAGTSVPAFLADQLDIPGLDALVGAFVSTEQFGLSDSGAATVGRAVKKIVRMAPTLRLNEDPHPPLSFDDAARIIRSVHPVPLCEHHTIAVAGIMIENLANMQLLVLDREKGAVRVTAEALELTELAPAELGRALLDYYPVGNRDRLILDSLLSLYFLYSDLVFHPLADMRGVHITQVQNEFLDHVEEALWPRQGGGLIHSYVDHILSSAACLGLRDREAPRGCIHLPPDVIGFLQEALRRALPEMLAQDRSSSSTVDAPQAPLSDVLAVAN